MLTVTADIFAYLQIQTLNNVIIQLDSLSGSESTNCMTRYVFWPDITIDIICICLTDNLMV